MISDVKAELGSILDTWNVQWASGRLDAPRLRTVLILPRVIERTGSIELQVNPGYTLWVLVPDYETADFEERLEDALIETVRAIEQTNWITWQTADRGILGDTLQGYRIDISTTRLYR